MRQMKGENSVLSERFRGWLKLFVDLFQKTFLEAYYQGQNLRDERGKNKVSKATNYFSKINRTIVINKKKASQ